MAQYFTDFSEYTTGQPPDDWSLLWNSSSSLEIKDDGSGGKYLEIRHDYTGDATCAVWDVISGSDVEVYSKFDTTHPNYARTCARISNASPYEDRDLYGTRKDASDTLLFQYLNGSYNALGSGGYTDGSDPYFHRFRANGDTISAKIWNEAESEPSPWDVTVSDTSIDSGLLGMYMYSGLYNVHIYLFEFGIGTNGDSAPTSSVASANPPTAPSGLTLTEI
jgi:hypothetical protein